jgi:hypothetical protein
VAFGRSTDSGGNRLGRAVAESSFHRFADYNWDPARGCPSFVTEPVGDSLEKNPRAAADIRPTCETCRYGSPPNDEDRVGSRPMNMRVFTALYWLMGVMMGLGALVPEPGLREHPPR